MFLLFPSLFQKRFFYSWISSLQWGGGANPLFKISLLRAAYFQEPHGQSSIVFLPLTQRGHASKHLQTLGICAFVGICWDLSGFEQWRWGLILGKQRAVHHTCWSMGYLTLSHKINQTLYFSRIGPHSRHTRASKKNIMTWRGNVAVIACKQIKPYFAQNNDRAKDELKLFLGWGNTKKAPEIAETDP